MRRPARLVPFVVAGRVVPQRREVGRAKHQDQETAGEPEGWQPPGLQVTHDISSPTYVAQTHDGAGDYRVEHSGNDERPRSTTIVAWFS